MNSNKNTTQIVKSSDSWGEAIFDAGGHYLYILGRDLLDNTTYQM